MIIETQLDNLIPQSDTDCMKTKQSGQTAAKPGKVWQPTQYANLIRYVPSGTFFARMRVAGKLIRQSLKTDVLTVAKLRLADMEKNERESVETRQSASKGRMTFGDCMGIFKTQTEASNLIKPSAKAYRGEVIRSILKSWPGLETLDVRKISPNDCNSWAAKFSNQYSGTRYNGAVGVLRAVFKIAIESGALHRNPAEGIKRAKIYAKRLTLPDSTQFELFLNEIERANGRDSRKCANLVRFLAFGGFRISEANNITWADCDFEKGEIVVRGDMETGTKNWTIRRVPMIPEMKALLERLQVERMNESLDHPVMQVKECIQAMTRAAKVVGMARITHHDLRHLFATLCIESGVDIPTVSRWLGHKDGGALAMKVYGHLRDQHSVAMAQRVTFSRANASIVIPLKSTATK
jgi:integrase